MVATAVADTGRQDVENRLRVLIAAPDSTVRSTLSRHLIRRWPSATVTASNDDGAALCRKLDALQGYDLLLVACNFDAGSGAWDGDTLEWLRRIRDSGLHPPVMIIADSGSEYAAVRALRAGASDYLPLNLLSAEILTSRVAELLGEPEAGERRRTARRTAAHMGLSPYGYELLRCLDYGDRRAVFLAHSRELDRRVVLKALARNDSPLTADDEYQRFAREYELISCFDHPGVAAIHDFRSSRRYCYIAMEYFPRGDLRARVREGMGTGEALQWIRAILDSLGLVHQSGMLHRDLKPSNVMIRDRGQVALIDFGLARAFDASRPLTVVGEIRGTPYYMSPEQAEGGDLDERSDLYSIGVILHELLTGRKPYTGRSPMEIIQQHVEAPLPQLPAALANLQPLLDALMAKAPDDRFSDVGAARRALVEALGA